MVLCGVVCIFVTRLAGLLGFLGLSLFLPLACLAVIRQTFCFVCPLACQGMYAQRPSILHRITAYVFLIHPLECDRTPLPLSLRRWSFALPVSQALGQWISWMPGLSTVPPWHCGWPGCSSSSSCPLSCDRPLAPPSVSHVRPEETKSVTLGTRGFQRGSGGGVLRCLSFWLLLSVLLLPFLFFPCDPCFSPSLFATR